MSEVKRWAHHVTWDGELVIQTTMMALRPNGDYVLASDYDKLAVAHKEEKALRLVAEHDASLLRAELAELKAKMEGMVLVPVELIEHVKHARKLLGGNGAPEWQREKLRQKLTDLLANAPAAPAVDAGLVEALELARNLLINNGASVNDPLGIAAIDAALAKYKAVLDKPKHGGQPLYLRPPAAQVAEQFIDHGCSYGE